MDVVNAPISQPPIQTEISYIEALQSLMASKHLLNKPLISMDVPQDSLDKAAAVAGNMGGFGYGMAAKPAHPVPGQFMRSYSE